jgi:hypothetical protein
MTLTTANFIENAQLVHGDRYDYSLVEYIRCKDKVRIICDKHGEFLQTPHKHVSGRSGCPACGAVARIANRPKVKAKSSAKYTDKISFLDELRRVYGDKYSYDLSQLNGCNSQVGVICRLHGTSFAGAKYLLKGQSHCKGCSKINKGGDSPKVFRRDAARANSKCLLYIVDTSFGHYKIGISRNFNERSKGRYVKMLFQQQLTRAEAWTVEQLILLQTLQWSVDSAGDWCGHTELRDKTMPIADVIDLAEHLCQSVVSIGWESYLTEITCD